MCDRHVYTHIRRHMQVTLHHRSGQTKSRWQQPVMPDNCFDNRARTLMWLEKQSWLQRKYIELTLVAPQCCRCYATRLCQDHKLLSDMGLHCHYRNRDHPASGYHCFLERLRIQTRNLVQGLNHRRWYLASLIGPLAAWKVWIHQANKSRSCLLKSLPRLNTSGRRNSRFYHQYSHILVLEITDRW